MIKTLLSSSLGSYRTYFAFKIQFELITSDTQLRFFFFDSDLNNHFDMNIKRGNT